jgi:hypothetical protein
MTTVVIHLKLTLALTRSPAVTWHLMSRATMAVVEATNDEKVQSSWEE